MVVIGVSVVKSSVVTCSVEGANVVAATVVSTTVVGANVVGLAVVTASVVGLAVVTASVDGLAVVAASVVGLAVVTASVVGDTELDTVSLDISQLTPEKPVKRSSATKACVLHFKLVNSMTSVHISCNSMLKCNYEIVQYCL